jgi:phosphatidylglycerophosphatase A
MINIFNTLFVTMFGLGKIRFIPGTFGSFSNNSYFIPVFSYT